MNGAGVRGLSGTTSGLATSAIGVLGAADTAGGVGVRGQSDLGTGVQGLATNGVGVSAESTGSVALNAAAAGNRAGVFQSGDPVGDGTSTGGVAQLQLIPARDSVLPTGGRLGDVWAQFSDTVQQNRQRTVSLWLCVNDNPVEWEQIVLNGTRSPGGTAVP